MAYEKLEYLELEQPLERFGLIVIMFKYSLWTPGSFFISIESLIAQQPDSSAVNNINLKYFSKKNSVGQFGY